jgi:nicotinamidase/pyrazinamidase
MNTSTLIVVDPQKGFSELCPNELPVNGAVELGKTIKNLIDKSNFGIKVLTKDTHPANAKYFRDENFIPINEKNMDISWKPHCVHGTYGFECLDEINEDDFDLIVYKGIENDMHPYGACYRDLAGNKSTGLIEYLLRRGVHAVSVCGIAFDYCVLTTALQLRDHFVVTVIVDATVSIDPNNDTDTLNLYTKHGIRLG